MGPRRGERKEVEPASVTEPASITVTSANPPAATATSPPRLFLALAYAAVHMLLGAAGLGAALGLSAFRAPLAPLVPALVKAAPAALLGHGLRSSPILVRGDKSAMM